MLRQWMRAAVGVLAAVALMGSSGCYQAELVWSPDGKQAAYRMEGKAFVIDEQGKVSSELGETSLGFAWSADGKTLYFAKHVSEEPGKASAVADHWLSPGGSDPAADSQPATMTVGGKEDHAVMGAWQDGAFKPIATLRDNTLYGQLSPDQGWLAVMAMTNGQHSRYELYAIALASGTTYRLSSGCGIGACFTGAHRLAYVEASGSAENPGETGSLAEVVLDEGQAKLERKTLLAAMPARTGWLAAVGNDLLFTAAPVTYPGKPAPDTDGPCSLYRYTRTGESLTVLADDAGGFFSPSPDGKRILYEKFTAATSALPAKHELAVMSANGSDGHVLRDVSALYEQQGGDSNQPPMLPRWRNDQEISFTSEFDAKHLPTTDSDGKGRLDVVLYHITDQNALEPVRTLSTNWSAEMKPYVKLPTTQPATQSTQPASMP